MADIPSTNSKIQVEETTYRAPVSETLTQRMGGSINYALDQVGTTSSGLAAETAARIAADNTINGKLVVRSSSAGGTVFNLGNNSSYGDGALIEEQSISPTHADTTNTWMLLQIRADATTTAGRQASYIQIDLLSDDDFGTQRLTTFTLVGGEHFGTVINLGNYSNPLTIRLRLYASVAVVGVSQRWIWDTSLRYAILNTSAVFGS
jgi:hypothetical protein